MALHICQFLKRLGRYFISRTDATVVGLYDLESSEYPSCVLNSECNGKDLGAYTLDGIRKEEHRSYLIDEFLESEDIHRMDWPVRAPDLIPIEPACDAMWRPIVTRNNPPRTI
ncbi:hypothetical protein TNCV_5117501 [Trichonephila clavipes]|nr:hypothetical protein TNCV_5117501 [Trichonephila clavipes]